MPGAQLLDFRLVVIYNGVKATQYFTKFTPESVDVFRRDLTALKLPHPKKENMTFVSHGHVECFWYDVQKNGVLHKNIRDKTQPNTDEGLLQLRQRLKDLSIGHILFKIIDPKSKALTKRPNPYAQRPSNEQEGSRPSKVARTETAQPPSIVATPQGVWALPPPQGVQTLASPQVVQSPRAVPFPFKKRDPINEPQSQAQLATNSQNGSSHSSATIHVQPPELGVRQILGSHRPGPRSMPAPLVSLAHLQKSFTNESLALGERMRVLGLHTNGGTKQPTPIPKAPLPERTNPAPIASVPTPQVLVSTQPRVSSTHILPLKPVASLPGHIPNRFSTTVIPATQVLTTTTATSSSKPNVPSSIPLRQPTTSAPLPAKPAPLALNATPGVQESADLTIKRETARTPPIPGLWQQSRDQQELQMRKNQEEGIPVQSRAQPQPPPPPRQPREGQESGFTRPRRNSRWERDSRPSTSAAVLPTPPTSATTTSSSGGVTIKTEPGLEPQRAFTPPPSEWVSPRRISFDPYNPFENEGRDQDRGINAVPRESMTNGPVSEANAVPVAVHKIGPATPVAVYKNGPAAPIAVNKNGPATTIAINTNGPATSVAVHKNGPVHPPTRPRGAGVEPTSTPRPSGPSTPAPSATDSIAIQRLTREAWDVKRQISANVERERVIIEELERLGSRWVPEGTTVDSGPNRKRKREDERMEGGGDGDELRHPKYHDDRMARALVASLTTRLSKAESSLSQTQATLSQTQSKLAETQAHLSQAKAEFKNAQADVANYQSKLNQAQSALTQVQATLTDEQRLRKEAEDAIADVRRECIKPFVVPSLLDAFVDLSKLTTRAMVSAQRGAALEDEREKRRREKGKSVDMGPPPLKSPLLPESTTKRAGDVQPRHGNADDQNGPSPLAATRTTSTIATTSTTPMNVGEVQSRAGRMDGSLKLPASASSAAINGVAGTSIGAVATTIPHHHRTLPLKTVPTTEDVDIHSVTPTSGHKIPSPLPTTTTAKGSSVRPNDGDVDMADASLASSISTKQHVAPSKVPLLSPFAALHIQSGQRNANYRESQQSSVTAVATSLPSGPP